MNGKKRILLVANSTWNIYNFRLNVIQKFIDEGCEVVVLAPVDEFIKYKEQFPEVRHYGIRSLSRNSTNPLREIVLVAELARKFRKIKPDFIINYTHKPNIFGTLAARICGIKSIMVITGLGYLFIRQGIYQRIMFLLYKLSARYSSMLIFENQDDRQLFIDEGITSVEKSVAVKGCGVNLEKFKSELPERLEKKSGIFAFIGRLLTDKGINEYVEAAKIVKSRYPEVQFYVLGDFDEDNPARIEREKLAEWVNEGLIDYRGFVHDVRPILSQVDCLILPSYREGMPRIIMEAMSMGLAVITTDTPGCRETVEDSFNGYLVPVANSEVLAESIIRYLSLTPEEKQKMGRNSRTMAERYFDEKLIASIYHQIYKRLV